MSNHIYNPSHKYIRWYISLIRKSQNRNEIIGYSESHHIFPKSIFGDNKSTVRLTAREHFIAHKILYKIYEIRYGCKHKFTIYMLKAISYMYTRDEIKNKYCKKKKYKLIRIKYSDWDNIEKILKNEIR